MPDKIKYLIVEDEERSRITLLKKIKICNIDDITCAGMATNAKEARLLAENTTPDFVLLDINLPDKNGFDLLDDLKKINPNLEVIFTSAHTENEILINALKKSPVNYLIKPIDIEELSDSIITVCTRIKNIKKSHFHIIEKKLHFTGFNGPIFILPEDVWAIKADGHYSSLIQANRTTKMLNQSLANIEQNVNLPSPPFFRADRSTIVNLQYIDEVKIKSKACLFRKEHYETAINLTEKGIKNIINKLQS